MAKKGLDFRGLNKEPGFEKELIYVGLMAIGIKTMNKDSKSVCPVCGKRFEIDETAITLRMVEFSRAYHHGCIVKLAETICGRFGNEVIEDAD